MGVKANYVNSTLASLFAHVSSYDFCQFLAHAHGPRLIVVGEDKAVPEVRIGLSVTKTSMVPSSFSSRFLY
jgi:hypothetical protein